MLLRFGIANYRSLRDRQELSFVASSLDDIESGLIEARHVPGHKVLPVLVIYGANAAGKTAVINALDWMRSAVLYSHSRGKPDGKIPRTPFALDASCASLPSQCEVDFLLQDVRYHYGFEAADRAFTSEWLFAYPNDRRQALFEREGMQFRFGRNLKGRNQIISELTRPNSLFLSAAAQNGHDELTKVAGYFESMTIGELAQKEISSSVLGRKIDERVLKFLTTAGTGVVDYRVTEWDPDVEHREFQEFMVELANKKSIDLKIDRCNLQFSHKGADGGAVYFGLHNESEGTRRLIRLLLPVFKALDAGTTMLVDELDASLHTQACELVIALFASPRTNPNGAQLVATTHDTNLLRSSHLRRDQVWLTEKDSRGATHLYPLTDFRTRKGDNLARGYLQGRYGAIPFAGDTSDILAAL
jgi:AAA15 family ATPase/GTPase